MTSELWNSGAELGFADNLLGLLALIAASYAYWLLATRPCHTALYVARWCIAVGWTILALRMLIAWWAGYDVQIAPVSLIALALLGAGSILRALYDLSQPG